MKIIKNRNQVKDSIRIYERYNMMINLITFIVFCAMIYYLYFINTYLDNYKHKQFIITFYQNIKLRLSLIALLFIFISGYFGKRLILLGILITFGYVISMIQLQQKYNIFGQSKKVEHMANVNLTNTGLPHGFYNNLEVNNLPDIDPLPYVAHTTAPDLPDSSNKNEHFTSDLSNTGPLGVSTQSSLAYNFSVA